MPSPIVHSCVLLALVSQQMSLLISTPMYSMPTVLSREYIEEFNKNVINSFYLPSEKENIIQEQFSCIVKTLWCNLEELCSKYVYAPKITWNIRIPFRSIATNFKHELFTFIKCLTCMKVPLFVIMWQFLLWLLWNTRWYFESFKFLVYFLRK